MKKPNYPSQVTKWQKAHISLKWPLIEKIRALYFLQLSKLKIRKCTYFHDQRPTWLIMINLLFNEETGFPSQVTKSQKAHISFKLPLIKKIKALSFLQLLKLKIRKCTYFYDQMPTWLVMIILMFQEEAGLSLTIHKMTKSSYIA